MCLWLGVFYLFNIFKGVTFLSLVKLDVPDFAATGKNVKLSCVYRLDSGIEKLYSIKWYKDNMEFYRYVPRDRPPAQLFPLEGLEIDLERSLNGTVYIKDLALLSSGIYKCEVSADYPSFQSVSAVKEMNVQEALELTGGTPTLSGVSCILFVVITMFALRW